MVDRSPLSSGSALRPARAFRLSRRRLRNGLLSAVFVFLIAIVPWAQIRGGFTDLERYRLNFLSGVYQFDWSANLFEWWRSEILWRWGIRELGYLLGDFGLAIFLASLISLCIFTYYVVKQSRSVWTLPILVSPHFIDLVFSQVRSALAVALLYLSIDLARRNSFRFFSFVTAGAAFFIHNFTGPLLLMGGGYLTLRLVSLPRWIQILSVLAGLVFAILVLTVLMEQALEAVSDRRLYMYSQASGFALTAVLFLTLSYGWRDFRNVTSDINVYILVCASVLLWGLFLSGQSGSSRIAAMALPALAVCISRIGNRKELVIFYGLILAANGIYWMYWIN